MAVKVEAPNIAFLSPQELLAQYRAGVPLSSGPIYKFIHILEDEEEKEILRAKGAAEGEAFWREKLKFRFSRRGQGLPNFYDVVAPTGVLEQFIEVVDPGRDDFIVDHGSGDAVLAEYLRPYKVKHYAAIDRNPEVIRHARRHLNRLGFESASVYVHDFSKGLPDKLEDDIKARDPRDVVHLWNWSGTYQDMERIVRLARACLSRSENAGYPTRLIVNMITLGKFNTVELGRYFKDEVVPRLRRERRYIELIRALLARGETERFGNEFWQVVPIWTVEEFAQNIGEQGLTVIRAVPILRGQSTAMEIQSSAVA